MLTMTLQDVIQLVLQVGRYMAGIFIILFLLYVASRIVGIGAARSWFQIKENIEKNGGNNNGEKKN